MANRQNRKIRLVKCPKCLGLLREEPNVPVYECGGCGTILQAKIRRNDLQNTSLDVPEIKTVDPSEQENVSKHEETCSTSQHVNVLSDEKCLLDQQDNQNKQNESGTDQLEVLNIPQENSSSVQQIFHENQESFVVSEKNVEVNENETNCSNLGSSNIIDDKSIEEEEEVEEKSQEGIIVHDLDRMGSTNSLGAIEVEEMSKSPLTGSPLAYNGSISSCDGNDDYAPEPSLRSHRSTFANERFVGDHECFFEKGKYPMEDIMWGKNVETQYQSITSSCNSDDEFPTMPFYHITSQYGFENGSPASRFHEFRYNSSICSPNNLEYLENENRKLLRMVHNVQDQLNRTHLAIGQSNPNFQQYSRNQEPNYRTSRFSESSTGSYREIDDRYMNTHFSVRGYDRTPRNNRAKTFESKDKDRVVKVKLHFRPIAGGAPFVSCYYCLKALQIPSDFLLFKKRYHHLKCGACEKVLKFTLQNTNHILPYDINSTNNDDFQQVSRKSCSTEPRRSLEGDADHRKIPILKKSVNEYEVGEPSTKRSDTKKRSLKIRDVSSKNSSPLHRLMGYSSISQVFK